MHAEARVLGVDFRQEGGLGGTTAKRRAQGRSITGRVACLHEVAFWHVRGVWSDSFPESETFTTQLKRAVGAHASLSRHLWQRLSGRWTHPHFYAVLASFGALSQGISYWRRHGSLHSGGGRSACLFGSLQGLGFVWWGQAFVHAGGQFCWPPPAGAKQFKGWLQQSTHLIREAWRRRCYMVLRPLLAES